MYFWIWIWKTFYSRDKRQSRHQKRTVKLKASKALHFQIYHTESTFLFRVEFLSMPDIKFQIFTTALRLFIFFFNHYSDTAIVLFPLAFRHPFHDEGDHTHSTIPHLVVQRDANVTPRDAVSRIAAADRRWFVIWGDRRRLVHRKCSPGVSSGVPKCAAFINYTVV